MKIDVSIEGLSPGLLMNRYTENSSDQVEETAYKTEEGKLYQPAEHILRAMAIAASTFRPDGGKPRRSYAKVFGSGLVQIEPSEIIHKNQAWIVDSRPVKGKPKKKILRRRVRLPNWQLDFTIVVGDGLTPEIIKNVLEKAGYYVGIGDFRPQRKGPFGRFKITRFELAVQ